MSCSLIKKAISPLIKGSNYISIIPKFSARLTTMSSSATPIEQLKQCDLNKQKYPAKQHALNVKQQLKSKLKTLESFSLFLSSEIVKYYPYSDSEQPFRQNRYFYYLTGCNLPNTHVFFDLSTEELVLFLPEVTVDDMMWSGSPLSIEEAAKKFDVDKVCYEEEIDQYLTKNDYNLTTDINDSNKKYRTFLSQGDKFLLAALDESRLIKDDYEIELIRKAAKITDNSHLAVMSALPIERNETHIHAEFVYHSIRQGSKNQSYAPICCSGNDCSILHYNANDKDLEGKHSILLDAGAEWENYCSDVTRCFPINGDWKIEHLEIYNIVLKMQQEAENLIKPGVLWDEVHLETHRVLIEEFLKLGIFKPGFSATEIFESNISTTFYPHGLGHLMGLDTHDVGGRPDYEDPDPKLRYLRLRRKLQKGMVVTNEPGVYFAPYLIELGLKSEGGKYIDVDTMNKYLYIGGVRIEDDLLITKDGFENLTKITKDPKEISNIIKAGLSKDLNQFHNIV